MRTAECTLVSRKADTAHTGADSRPFPGVCLLCVSGDSASTTTVQDDKPAGLTMGASSFPIVSLCACLMFGMPEVSPATSFRRHIVVAKALVTVTEGCEACRAFAADRNGRTMARLEAIAGQWPAR